MSEDSQELLYRCGACGRSRPQEKIAMTAHPNESLESFPICVDSPCSIEYVDDPTDSGSEYQITEELS